MSGSCRLVQLLADPNRLGLALVLNHDRVALDGDDPAPADFVTGPELTVVNQRETLTGFGILADRHHHVGRR